MLFFLSLVLLAAPHRVTDDTGCNKGLDANNELDGEIICTFGDGTKKYEGVYAHGKRVGLAKSWRQNGVLASVDRFVDGKRDGLCEEYGPDGLLTESCVYKADLKDGRCKLHGREGKLREERLYVAGQQRGAFTAYWPNGKVVERGALDESGRPHGVKERFREDGTPDSLETYVHGEKDGVEREWHPNGKLRRETWWKKNVQHGLMKDFHENGGPQSESCYQDGARVTGTNLCTGKSGPEVVTRFLPDGKPYETTAVKDGKRNGEHQQFDRDGKLSFSERFVDDVRDGPQREFKAGVLQRELNFVAGKRQGLEKRFFEDGKLAEETTWQAERKVALTTYWMNGKKKLVEKRDGDVLLRTRWYDDGTQEGEETLRVGYDREVRDGPAREWSEKGTLIEVSNWKAGRRDGTQKAFFAKNGAPWFTEEWSGGARRARIEWGEDGAVVKDEKYNADGSRQ